MRRESPNIYYARNMCLGGDISRGENQKPFNGRLDYDFIMWIDSDVLFKSEQFKVLLEHDKDIVSGLYLMKDGVHFATVKEWDENFFKKNGYFQFLKPEDLNGQKDLLEVAYTGMGFMLVKRGVFETMVYPWFKPSEKKIGDMIDFTTEDVSFCLKAKENGFRVFVDGQIRLGHEKKMIL